MFIHNGMHAGGGRSFTAADLNLNELRGPFRVIHHDNRMHGGGRSLWPALAGVVVLLQIPYP